MVEHVRGWMVSSGEIKVLVVDDHPLMRVGIAAIINNHAGMMAVAQAGSGDEAVELYLQHLPDITLMDLRLPQMSGVETIRTIRRFHKETRIFTRLSKPGPKAT
jgi:DNA-binding NarL/FixJ family response regulator